MLIVIKMKIEKISEKIALPEGVDVVISDKLITLKGPKGEVKREFIAQKMTFTKEDNHIVVTITNANKRSKTMIFTIVAHIKNMIKGVLDGFEYVLKICSGHFPMNVSLQGDTFTVKNFLGEKVPRTVKIKPNVEVKIDGEMISVKSLDKELAGLTAAALEQLTRISNRDRRNFQDGIYIISKAGKEQ